MIWNDLYFWSHCVVSYSDIPGLFTRYSLMVTYVQLHLYNSYMAKAVISIRHVNLICCILYLPPATKVRWLRLQLKFQDNRCSILGKKIIWDWYQQDLKLEKEKNHFKLRIRWPGYTVAIETMAIHLHNCFLQ